MRYLTDLIDNYVFVSALAAWFFAQLIKVIMNIFDKEGRRGFWSVMFSTGGMPSSHSSAVCALCISSAFSEGLASHAFAVTFVLAGVVMVDARGVRYETGKQARVLNRIVKELSSGNPEEINTGLKELVGHTPFQVIMGALLGVAVAVGMGFVYGYLSI